MGAGCLSGPKIVDHTHTAPVVPGKQDGSKPIANGAPIPSSCDFVNLNVGGKLFAVSRARLEACGSPPLLEVILSPPSADGSFFLDRDGRHFHYILNFMRDGKDFCAPEDDVARRELRHEARQLGLPVLAELLADAPQSVQAQSEDVSGNAKTYQGAPIPSNEVVRLQRLENLKILYSDGHDKRFDNFTRVVGHLFNVPTVLISLLHDHETWFKSTLGLDICSADRKATYCGYMLTPPDPNDASMLYVEDLRKDDRFKTNPLTDQGSGGFCFYVGAPLVLSDGIRLGALCALDTKPRALSPGQGQCLVNLSLLVVQEIEREQLVEKALVQHTSIRGGAPPSIGDFAAGPLRADRMRAALNEAVLLVRVRTETDQWPVIYANDTYTATTGKFIKSPSTPAEVGVDEATGWESFLFDGFKLPDGEMERIRNDLRAAWATALPDCFALSAQASIKQGDDTSKTYGVALRFSPAERALDVNASAVRALPARGMERISSSFQAPMETLYFVTAMFDEVTKNESTENPPLPDGPPPSLPDKEKQVAKRKRKLLGQKQNSQSGERDDLSALDSIKPPVSPFVDVVLVRRVAAGSFGTVYYGLWCGSPCAVKVLIRRQDPADAKKSGQGKTHSINPAFEATLSVSLSHPNLVQTYKHSTRHYTSKPPEEEVPGTVSDDAGFPETWIVQQWCEGGTLGDFCDKPGAKLPLVDACEAAVEISRAVAYLHSRDIVHGDLSPSNVLFKGEVSRKGFVCKICDFGLACVAGAQEIKSGSLGTITHMPPERLMSDAVVKSVDVYSVGILLWQLMTRKRPFMGLTWAQVVFQVCEGRCPQFPEDGDNDVKSVREVYSDCTAFDVEKRPAITDIVTRLGNLVMNLEGQVMNADMKRMSSDIRQMSAPTAAQSERACREN